MQNWHKKKIGIELEQNKMQRRKADGKRFKLRNISDITNNPAILATLEGTSVQLSSISIRTWTT